VTLRIVTLAVAVLIAFGLKRHYAEARAEDLAWILGPTARVVELMTGTTFAPEAGEGYLSRERMFVIEKACAGVNFMIAAFGMLALALRHRIGSVRSAAGVLGMSLAASYVTAVLVNAVRIDIAMWLAANPAALPMSAASVHRLEGVAVYFGGLLVLYELVHRLDGRGSRLGRAALPLGSYYAVALGLPLVNGAPWSATFMVHALVVLLVPLVLIALASIMIPEPSGSA